MTENLTIAGAILVEEFPVETTVSVSLAREDVAEWARILEALRAAVADRLCVRSRNSPYGLELSLASRNRPPLFGRWASPFYTLQLTAIELDRWIQFARSALREGGADVDHIDVEAEPPHSSDRPSLVIIRVPLAKAPVSAAVARKVLGLDQAR